MDENVEKYIDLINSNEALIDGASNKYGYFPLIDDDQAYIQVMIDCGFSESLGTLAAWGGIAIYEQPRYSDVIEEYRRSELAKSLNNDEFDFLMMYGISYGLLDYYRKIESDKADGMGYDYDEKYLSIYDCEYEIINVIIEHQKMHSCSKSQ